MTSLEPIVIEITGAGPYGFRLFGGDQDPLVVAKLRVQSKAHDAGLREDDVIVAINRTSCETMSHADAMRLLDSATNLHLHVIRNAKDREAMSAVYQSLQLLPHTPQQHQQQQHNTGDPIQHEQYPHAPHISTTVTKMTSERNHNGTTIETTIRQEQHMSTEVFPPQYNSGSAGVQAQFQFSGVTGVDGAVFSGGGGEAHMNGGAGPMEETIVYRHVPHIASQPPPPSLPHPTPENRRPGVWAPGGVGGGAGTVAPTRQRRPLPGGPGGSNRPPGVIGHIHLEEIKENLPLLPPLVPPQSSATKNYGGGGAGFRVGQVSATPWIWRPSHVPEVVSEKMEDFRLDPVNLADLPPVVETRDVEAREGDGRGGGGREGGGKDDIPLHLIKILTSIEDVDPNAFKKKKIFADSSFYDDPEHKYPTIEEQIKMARKVALSLTAPVNVTARGQQMFIKRKERSQQWIIDHPGYHHDPSSGEDLYYNPTPWHASSTSGEHRHRARPLSSLLPGSSSSTASWQKKTEYSSSFKKSNKFGGGGGGGGVKKLSFAAKSGGAGSGMTGGLGPRACFGLSDELSQMRGKGGELFARRRAKSEEDDDVTSATTTSFQFKRFGQGPGQGKGQGRGDSVGEERVRSWSTTMELEREGESEGEGTSHASHASAQCRLKEMIDRGSKSPWDAGVDYGLGGSVGGRFSLSTTPLRTERPGTAIDFTNGSVADRSSSSTSMFKSRRSTAAGYRPVRFQALQNPRVGAGGMGGGLGGGLGGGGGFVSMPSLSGPGSYDGGFTDF